MKKFALFTAMIIGGSGFAAQQQSSNPTPSPESVVDQAKNQAGAKYGRIKEVKDKQKIVIDIENGGDKTYNLADAKMTIDIAEGLAVGDKVKVLETKKKGAQSVQIVRDIRENTQERTRQQ
jgi:hypothetical protein